MIYVSTPLIEIRQHSGQASARHLASGRDVHDDFSILSENLLLYRSDASTTQALEICAGRARATRRLEPRGTTHDARRGSSWAARLYARQRLCDLSPARQLCTHAGPSLRTWRQRQELQPAAASSIEERLKKLDELHKKGLITDAEYDKKRVEILSEI